jgi:DNA invertase Pin-like site-specific DNA recombinase
MKRIKVTVMVEESRLDWLMVKLKELEIPWTKIAVTQDRVTAGVAAAVYRLLEQGHAVRDISQRTSVSKSTVSRIGRHPDKYGLDKKPLNRRK